MITKELLSEVLNTKDILEDGFTYVPYIQGMCDEGIAYTLSSGESKFINIHQIINECKKWALDNGYILEIENTYSFGKRKCCVYNTKWEKLYKTVKDTEPNVVFLACKWIIENKDKQ